jgi:hypothetical protein
MISDFMRVVILVMMALVASLIGRTLKFMWSLIRTTTLVVVNTGKTSKRQEGEMQACGSMTVDLLQSQLLITLTKNLDDVEGGRCSQHC